MDHLCLPEGAQLPEEDRVYYTGSVDYLKCRFVNFPVGRGFLSLPNNPLAQVSAIENYDFLVAPGRLDAFIQEWLFCSFLKEVFHDRFPKILSWNNVHAEFVRPHPLHHQNLRQVMCTDTLPALAEVWLHNISANLERSVSLYQELVEIANMVSMALKSLNYLKVRNPPISHDAKTVVVIATTVDFVVTMIKRAFEHHEVFRRSPIDQSSWTMFGWRDTYVERLVGLGWCRHEAASLALKLPILQVRHFCINMERQSALNHSNCTKEACEARKNVQMGDSKHKPPDHADPNCSAYAIVGDSLDEMLGIIRNHGRPLLKMRLQANKLEIDLLRWNGKDNYIAVSHVWSDGMGNENNNSLYRCQLESLYERLMRIPYERAETGEVLVWIDTLCCPTKVVSSQGEWAEVIGEMDFIYAEAKLVFVLDAELESIDRPSTLLETAFRILISDWMHRLWTLQEGYLAKEVWVQFRNGPFELDQVGIRSMDLKSLTVSQHRIGEIVKTLYASLRTRRMREETITRQDRVGLAAMALQNRSVTHPWDEPLCLATLLSLGAKNIADAITTDQNRTSIRMSLFWTLLQNKVDGFPKSILFHSEPRLLVDGFRWAPASLLGQAALPLMTTLFAGPLVPNARFNSKGFKIQSEGILFPQPLEDWSSCKPITGDP